LLAIKRCLLKCLFKGFNYILSAKFTLTSTVLEYGCRSFENYENSQQATQAEKHSWFHDKDWENDT
jgi:hypothetical protein